MNELIQPEFETLLDAVPDEDRPKLADLMDLVDAYEAGDFSRPLEYLDLFSAIKREKERGFMVALSALLRIIKYAAELTRAKACDSTPKETET